MEKEQIEIPLDCIEHIMKYMSIDDIAKIANTSQLSANLIRTMVLGHGDSGQVNAIAFSPNGLYLATGSSWDNSHKIWDMINGKCTILPKDNYGKDECGFSIAWINDNILAIGAEQNRVYVYKRLETGVWTRQIITIISEYSGNIISLSYNNKNNLLLIANDMPTYIDTETKDIHLYTYNEETNRFSIEHNFSHSIFSQPYKMYTRFIASIDYLCIYTDRGFNIANINNIDKQKPIENIVEIISYNIEYEKEHGEEHGEEHEEESGEITSSSFSNDGTLLAIASHIASHNIIVIYTYNNEYNIWYKKRKAIKTDDDDIITSIAFSPTNTKIITGSYDGKIQILDVSSGKRIGTLVGHSKCITSIAINPINHDQLVTGSWDHTVRIWNLNKNTEEKEEKEEKD